MLIGLLLSVVLLIIVASIEVPSGNLGKFERDRRKKHGDLAVERELARADIVSIRYILIAVLLVIVTAFAIATFDWLLGIIIGCIVALEYGAAARLTLPRRLAELAYKRVEPSLLGFSQKYAGYLRLVRSYVPETPETELHSRDELQHLVTHAPHNILTNDERKFILSGLEFAHHEVRDVMTPRSMIDAINKTEVLGPLVLDDLHKKGHSRFPVIETDVDHVVGVLHLRDVLRIDTGRKHTAKVETAMEQVVYYINERQTLDHALAAFIKTHHHLFIVVNEFRETVGLLTLEDVIESLIGKEIVDEFDTHDDLRVVAARSPQANQGAQQTKDV
jgi:CBS domain containing-hemolysin-like protein